MTQQPPEEFVLVLRLCSVCNSRGVLRKVVRVDDQGGLFILECGHRQIKRKINLHPIRVSDRPSVI